MKYEYTQNRELSWLKFNERCLEEASNKEIPVLERLNFYEIFNSNLDEFFMIRVGSLKDLYQLNEVVVDSKTNMTPKEQLDNIYIRVRDLYAKREAIYEELVEELASKNIIISQSKNLNQDDLKKVKKIIKNDVFPFLSPQLIDFNHPFPNLENKTSYIIVTLSDKKNKELFGILEINNKITKSIYLNNNYLFVEKLLYDFVDLIFKGYKITTKNIIRVTRNGDLNVEDSVLEEHDDFRKLMKQLLKKRKTLTPVRLECHKKLDDKIKNYLLGKLNLTENEVFISKPPFSLGFFNSELRKKVEYKNLLYPKLEQVPCKFLKSEDKIINQVRKHDVLLFYPFNSIDPFVKLIKEAAYSKTVQSIKITIYRLASKSKLVDYLCLAAEMGKEVTVLIELRARFDEMNNIDYSERLEYSGCKVMYGFDEFKVHSKLCLITENINGEVSYITQIGTGNYNETTVNIYTDYSLITANKEIGYDAAMFFQNMSLANLDYKYDRFLVSPYYMRDELIAYIDDEIKKKEKGYIFLKLNSITDLKLINKLVEASQAGVKINMIVRGICCILPQVSNYTDNITIKSIVGRFLEHSRIYQFGKGQDSTLFISSADWMTRNTIRRVEVAVPILDNKIKQEILDNIEIMWHDNVNGRILGNDGNYYKINNDTILLDSHKYFLTPLKVESKSIKNNLLSNFNKLLKINNVNFKRKALYNKQELAYNVVFEYEINNNYIEVINLLKNDKMNKHLLAKYLYINKILENNNDNLYLVIKNNDTIENLKAFSDLGIKVYNKDNINDLIKELTKKI